MQTCAQTKALVFLYSKILTILGAVCSKHMPQLLSNSMSGCGACRGERQRLRKTRQKNSGTKRVPSEFKPMQAVSTSAIESGRGSNDL